MISLLIFVIQLYLFSTLAAYLHYASARIGLAPLLFMLAGIIGLLNVIELNGLEIILSPTLTLRPGGHIFVPVSLLIILMLYVAHGTRSAQIAVIGIIGVNLLVFFTLLFLASYVNFPDANVDIRGLFTDESAFNFSFIRAMLASMVAFALDMLILIIVYQGANNHVHWLPKWLIPGIALIVALWADSAIFNIGAFVGTDNFSLAIPSDILIKTIVGILLTPLAGVYLLRFAPQLPDFVGPEKRHTLSILFRKGHRDVQVETLESELRISRSIYNQLTHHIEEIFWLIDIEERRFIYISPAYERLTNTSVEPLYQDINNLLSIVNRDSDAITEDSILQFLTSEEDTQFDIISGSKGVRTLRARAFPINDEQGNVIRYAGIAEDITERKKLTDQEFELALTRERMKILHDFISDASHDLKTPISSMILKIDMLDRIENDMRRREIRQELRGRAMHLSDLITDLFTLSRIESHDMIEMATMNINELVTGVVQDTQPLAEAKGLILNVSLTSENTQLEANAEQMTRLASNLISNAIRYTQDGTIWVKTWLEQDLICLSVQDTGIGIPAESLTQVFERFFRTNQAKDTQEGTGLGLAISKAISERHHGTLTVESVHGKGSTFTLKLPRSQAKVSDELDTRRSTQEIRALPSDS